MTIKHNLKYDITDLQAGESVLSRYPELEVYPEFQKEDERWLKYVIFSQDVGSGFLRIKDIEKQKQEAMLAAGFTRGRNGAWSDERCQAVMLLRDEAVNAMIWRYLRSVMFDTEFAFYMSLCETLWQDIQKIREPIAPKETAGSEEKKKRGSDDKETDVQRAYALRASLTKEIPERIEVKKKLEKLIFKDDENLRRLATSMEEQADEDSVEAIYQQFEKS